MEFRLSAQIKSTFACSCSRSHVQPVLAQKRGAMYGLGARSLHPKSTPEAFQHAEYA